MTRTRPRGGAMGGSLKNPGYRERLLDREVGELMGLFGAVKIEGPKYCGKTWCAQAHANSEIRLDREAERNHSATARTLRTARRS